MHYFGERPFNNKYQSAAMPAIPQLYNYSVHVGSRGVGSGGGRLVEISWILEEMINSLREVDKPESRRVEVTKLTESSDNIYNSEELTSRVCEIERRISRELLSSRRRLLRVSSSRRLGKISGNNSTCKQRPLREISSGGSRVDVASCAEGRRGG